ncbi:asparagine synthase (glutamine-hydrolyzing) [Desulfovibrio oxyclinae]|uniref:asparagine synthase (glutamine-hydrolyzing) n=1 Tax=Desulfovibrio oxyclinae TaxID=63560 RepID=UPI0003A3217F|nr:asparagine synthase (glutamine-hydrolyzing) [Desulfovibrio oxyclinae]
MCGITGFISSGSGSDSHCIERMVESLSHRGPDQFGVWNDGAAGVALGHRRLSILDLSPLGRQPMVSACGRYVIVYNGEVYNHLTLRNELHSYPFKSSSDTETILAAVSAWGVGKAIEKFVGMFAFGLWDKKTRKLTLVRDRLGIKPLYYGIAEDGAWVFGSELKALHRYPAYSPSIDRNALALFFRHNYIPAPYSIYEKTWKLEPGQMVVLGEEEPEVTRWWDIDAVWREGFDNPWQMSDHDAVNELESLLSDAVGIRMLSDVPLGAFLSGGIDSSTIVALMQKQATSPVKTFSIGFHEAAFNEAKHARAVADHLGTDHTELYVTSGDLLDVVPSMPQCWDEPFADLSQIPTYILSKLTREQVTVSLSGDGGDELFSGYARYFYASKWDTLTKLPVAFRRIIMGALKVSPPSLFKLLGSFGPKLRWRLDLLGMREFCEFYRYILSHFKHPDEFVLGAQEWPTPLTDGNPVMSDRFAYMALKDLQMYLPGDILTKVDRASMAVGLEARVPLLDHRVVEFAARTPVSSKIRVGEGKWLLRQVLYRHVPQKIVDRPKMGFGVPIEGWMRNELREWCEDMLSPEAIARQGFIDPKMVERMWNEFLGGETDWNYYLWDILMFQSWLEEWA